MSPRSDRAFLPLDGPRAATLAGVPARSIVGSFSFLCRLPGRFAGSGVSVRAYGHVGARLRCHGS